LNNEATRANQQTKKLVSDTNKARKEGMLACKNTNKNDERVFKGANPEIPPTENGAQFKVMVGG
jgi:hypothetical protein